MGQVFFEDDWIPNMMLWLLAILVVAIILWDTAMTVRAQPQHTVSEIFFRWSATMPAFPFVVGFVCGHLFWRR